MSRQTKAVKEYLFDKYGYYCEVCKKRFKRSALTGHHIIMKSKGGEASIENILIACHYCHFVVINDLEYDSEEYWELMYRALKHRSPEDIGKFPFPKSEKD